ncbi:MAG: methionine--tRNA ligase, partial [Patescibacteria group bacterium]
MQKPFFISTAIDYVNASPHLGHALEKVQADAIARYNRLLNADVFFLTGSDENSLKNVRAAEKQGISVQEFVDRNTQKFKDLRDLLNLGLDDFIRTTESRHIKGVQKLWQECDKRGDIYQDIYEGLYCVGCEAYLTGDDLENGLCPEHKTAPEQIKEKNWFFRLSKYQESIQKAIDEGKLEIIPDGRRNEILSFLKQDLRDICISRSNERAKNWGIGVPGDDTQKVWCWFDALGNYITALGYGGDETNFQKYWQKGQALHIIGKGISRFHAVYWLGILLSAGLKIPDKIFIHGYITVNGQKMSKSLGNVIDPFALVDKYAEKIGNRETAIDAVRYFLLGAISPTEDGDFTYEKFEERYNADLANGIGNLVARVVTLAAKLKMKNEKVKTTIQNEKLKKTIEKTKKNYVQSLAEFKFNEALGAVWELIGFCDKYVNETKPWETGNEKIKMKNEKVVADLLSALIEIAGLLKPFMPQTAEKILQQLASRRSGIESGASQPASPAKRGEPLFP